MQPLHEHSRINLAELKAQIAKNIGTEGSKQYFYCLSKFLSSKLNKFDFNKLCLKILGRDTIPLHNQLVRSILKNACTAKVSPPASQKGDFSKHSTPLLRNGSRSQAYGSPGSSNGFDLLPVSPRKARSVIRDLRTSGDRRIVLGQHRTSDVCVLENGGIHLTRQLERSKDSSIVSRSDEDESHHDHIVRDEGKGAFANIPLEAPFGLKFGSQRDFPSKYMGTSNVGALLDSFTLREQMEQIAVRKGLGGVSLECGLGGVSFECASILNHGLDSYLKAILKSCMESKNNASVKLLSYRKPINGVKPGYKYLEQNNTKTLEVQENHRQCSVSLQNLRVAMELNPSLLGEDWPWFLERISSHAFDE